MTMDGGKWNDEMVHRSGSHSAVEKIFRCFILEPPDSRGGGEKRQIHIGVEVTAASPGTGERVVPKKCFQKGMKLFIM